MNQASNAGTVAPATADLANLIDIVQLINRADDELELIESVVAKLHELEVAAAVVFRTLVPGADVLAPPQLPSGYDLNDPLATLINTAPVPAHGSFEGHALFDNRYYFAGREHALDLPIVDEYRDVALEVVHLGCDTAHFFPVRTAEPLGALTVYSIGSGAFDESRAVLVQRSAQVLAFGIEKCRVLAEVDRQRGELQETNDRLKASNRDLQDFAYVASHDLQEPLRKIQAFGDRLESKAADRLDDEQLQNLDKMREASKKMQLLINDLLSFSRVTTAKLTREPIALGELVAEVLAARSIGAAKVHVDTDLPAVWADRVLLTQVLDALVSNALKFTTGEQQVRIDINSSEPKEGTVAFSVSDNGIGFDPKFGVKIFEPFKRLHSHADYEGSGIGLAVCRRILDRHGGEISVTSTTGAGATFTVSLPAPSSQQFTGADV